MLWRHYNNLEWGERREMGDMNFIQGNASWMEVYFSGLDLQMFIEWTLQGKQLWRDLFLEQETLVKISPNFWLLSTLWLIDKLHLNLYW